MEAQRFPWDFNGIAVGAPGLPMGNAFLSVLWASMANVAKNGTSILRPADVKLIHEAVLARCDMDDGVKDGMVSNPKECRFDPAELACKSAKTAQCLAADQIQAARKIYAGPKTSGGETIQPGSAVGSELNWIGDFVASDGSSPSELEWGAEYFKYMAFNPAPGPGWKPENLNLDEDYKRFGMMDVITNSNNPDLRQFKKAGGKIIAYHSWADSLNPPFTLIDYFSTVQNTMGGAGNTKDFFRLFVLPGMDHCTGGVGAYAVDYLSYLEAWVERGEAPDQLLSVRPKGAIDINDAESRYPAPILPLAPGDVEFTRPVYPYPAWAKYKGTGDPKRAESFVPVKDGKSSVNDQTMTRLSEIIARYTAAGIKDSGVVPTAAQWQTLLESSYQGKIVLVTLYKLDPKLTKKDIPNLASEEYKKFLQDNSDAGVVLLDGTTLFNFIGDDEDWDMVSAVEFSSRESLARLMENPRFIEFNKVRPQIISRQRTLILQSEPAR